MINKKYFMSDQQSAEKFQEYLELIKQHDFGYVIERDLDTWKQGINKEYIIRKKIEEIIGIFGIDQAQRILNITLDQVQDILVMSVVHTTIKLWFAPYLNYRNVEKTSSNGPSQYKLQNHNSLKNSDKTDRMS